MQERNGVTRRDVLRLPQAIRITDVVVPYDPKWPAHFETERFALDAILSPWLVAGVHHIGSTAIPNMPAKPILDMMAGVSSPSCTQQAEHTLGRVGYRLSPHRVDAALFVRTDAACADTHHVRLTVPASDLWRERLTFRDALRRDPQLVEA